MGGGGGVEGEGGNTKVHQCAHDCPGPWFGVTYTALFSFQF